MRDLKALVDGLAKAKKWAGLDYSGKQKREIEADVVLGPAKDCKGNVVLELSVHHDKDDKRYVASVRIVTIEELESGFTSRRYNLSLGRDNRQMAYLDRVDSGRYSAKALEAFWELQMGKLQDNPTILANLDLDYNQDEPEDENAGWWEAGLLLDALEAQGIKSAWVWQSGGGTATFMLPNESTGLPLLVGPGSYHWQESRKSLFTMDELSYGLDHNDWYERFGLESDEPESFYVDPKSSIEDAAKQIAEQYRKYNEQYAK